MNKLCPLFGDQRNVSTIITGSVCCCFVKIVYVLTLRGHLVKMKLGETDS